MEYKRITVDWDHERLKRDRLARLQAQMVERDIGGMYLTEGCHTRYLLDAQVPVGKVFVPVEGELDAFVRGRDIGYIQKQHGSAKMADLPPTEVREADGMKGFARDVSNMMTQHGVAGERIGIDSLRPELLLELFEAGLKVVPAEIPCERATSVKTQDELAMYRGIGEQYRQTIGAFRDAIKPGLTELDLAAVVTATWAYVGGEDVAQLNVCTQENTNPWRRWSTERVIQPGDIVGIDFHGRSFGGLRGDCSDTFLAADEATPEQRTHYREAYEYLQAAIKELRAGRTIADVLASQPPIPAKYREQQINYNMAHGVGINHSGYPHIDPRRKPIDDVLFVDQVMAVECHFGADNEPYGVKLEELVRVTDGAPEILVGLPVDKHLMN
ncbi:MAG TPA: M24 family metallopeptidase [Chloroflexota bacterium]